MDFCGPDGPQSGYEAEAPLGGLHPRKVARTSLQEEGPTLSGGRIIESMQSPTVLAGVTNAGELPSVAVERL